MEIRGKGIDFIAWETQGAEVKTSFDSTPIVDEFNARLCQNLAKKGLDLTQKGVPMVVQGRVIRIDEGNRLVRYFLGYAANAGQVVLEVEGELVADGKKLADLYTRGKSGGLHLFGGAGDGLLKMCARQCAHTIANQVVKGIERSEGSVAPSNDLGPSIFGECQRTPRQWAAASETRMKQGERGEALVLEIMGDGYPQKYAESIVGEALRSLNNRSWTIIGCSTLLFLGGILFTIATYSTARETAASQGEGTYFVWFGAVICGLIGLIYGLGSFPKAREKEGAGSPAATGQTSAAPVESATPILVTPPAHSPDGNEAAQAPVMAALQRQSTISLPAAKPVVQISEQPAANPPAVNAVPPMRKAAGISPAPQPVPVSLSGAAPVQSRPAFEPPPYRATPEKRHGLPVWAWVLIAGGLFFCLIVAGIMGVSLLQYRISRSSLPANSDTTLVAPRVAAATSAAQVIPMPDATRTPTTESGAQPQGTEPAAQPAPGLPALGLLEIPGAMSPQNFGTVTLQGRTEEDATDGALTCLEIAWFPDNERLAFAGYEAHVIDFHTTIEEAVTTGQQWVDSIVVSPDAKYLVTSSGATGIILWDAATKTEIREFSMEGDVAVEELALSPDGKTLAAATSSGFSLFDVDSGQRLSMVPNQNGPYTIAFSPDGEYLAGGGAELILWEVPAISILQRFEGGQSGVSRVAFSPDGKVLAASYNDGAIILFDVASGEKIVALTGHTQLVDAIDFSPDGRLLASIGRDHAVRFWDMSSGTEVGVLNYGADLPTDVRFSPDGSMVAACGHNNPLYIWGLPDSKVSQPTATWAPPTTTVAPANAPLIVKNNQLDLEMGAKDLAWPVDNQVLIGGYGITSYDPTTNTQIKFGSEQWIYSMALSPDGRTLAIASYETLNLISGDGQEEMSLNIGGDISVIAFSPDGETLAVSINEAVKLFDVDSGSDLTTLPIQMRAQDLTFTPDGRSLAVVSGYNVVIWDIASRSATTTYDKHIQSPKKVVFSPDGKLMAVGGSDGSTDGKVVLWDVVSGQWVRTFAGHKNNVNDMAFSADGRWLATVSADLTLRVWDVASGTLLNELTGHTSAVNAVAFSPDQTRLVSGGDQEIIIWTITAVNE